GSILLVNQNRRARQPISLIAPCVTTEPVVQSLSATVEALPIVALRKRAGKDYFSHTGRDFASSRRRGRSSGGDRTQSSNFSQSSAGMTIGRGLTRSSNSAASTAFRRIKSLRLV